MPALDRIEEKKVHIDHKDGSPLYDRLYLSTSAYVLLFESGHGFIDTLDVERFGWTVKDGWRK